MNTLPQAHGEHPPLDPDTIVVPTHIHLATLEGAYRTAAEDNVRLRAVIDHLRGELAAARHALEEALYELEEPEEA